MTGHRGDLFSLEGKVAFVTGAAGGIALGITQALAAAGARLALTDRSEEVADRAAELGSHGVDAASFVFDITDSNAVTSVFAQAQARYTQSLLMLGDKTIGLLDERLLLHKAERALA